MSLRAEEFPVGNDLFAECGADGVNGLIDHLAEPQFERRATQDVCVDFGKTPSAGEQVNHAAGRR